MGIALASVVESAPASETLTVLESVEHNGKRLAVAETSGAAKDLVLVREHERGLFASGSTESTGPDDKRSRENGTESYWKRTARLADIADAVASGLLTSE